MARTTEGSGLGLSIAKDLTRLQGGSFDVYIDGDLFKAQVGFPVLKERDLGGKDLDDMGGDSLLEGKSLL